MNVYLSAEHVRKTFGATVALADASLELREGETLALLGPNGAGKTTLVKILATLLTKDSGRVEILGYDLDTHALEIRHLFGYVGQDTDRSAYARLNVVENLRFFGALRGLGVKQIDRQIEKLATYFDFKASLDKQFMHLSGGQKQTMVIIRALLHDPPLVYLDEPTKGLDPIVAKRIRSFLKTYVHKERRSLLLTSHILSEVEYLAERVALMYAGQVTVVNSPQALMSALGATDFIELQASALPAATLEKILRLEPVLLKAELDSEWVSFGLRDLLAGTEAIIRVLREDQVATKIRYHTATLEDAFVHHVGKLTDKFD